LVIYEYLISLKVEKGKIMQNSMEFFKKGFEKVNVVTICQDLIRISSINPPGDELTVANYCGDFLRHLGFEVNLILHSEKRASILACLRGSGQLPGVMVCGHLDTVPTGAIPWQHKPLGGDIDDGKIWGRGSSDMKGGIAALLASAKVIVESGFSLQGDLWVALTAGEEVDFLGAKEISKHFEVLPLQVLLIPEPSSNAIFLAQKGALWLEISMQGKTAHASMPDLGINTVEMMSQFIYQFKSLDFPYKAHPLLDGCTAAVTTIKGGEKTNVVPDECRTTIDIRTMPGQNHKEMLDQIVNLLKNLEKITPGLKTNVKVLNDRAAVVTDMDNPIVSPIHKAASDVLGYEVPIKGVRFFTDSAVLTPAWDVPMILCGPGHAELAHQPDEYVEISLLKQAVEIYTLALSSYLGKKMKTLSDGW
jgi:succinyl-diaminopimelate desuccinylase